MKTARARQARKCLTALLCDSKHAVKHAVISRLLTANVRGEKRGFVRSSALLRRWACMLYVRISTERFHEGSWSKAILKK